MKPSKIRRVSKSQLKRTVLFRTIFAPTMYTIQTTYVSGFKQFTMISIVTLWAQYDMTPSHHKWVNDINNEVTSIVLVGLTVILPGAWVLDADGGGSVDMILNGALASNLMVSGVSEVFPSTNRWTSGVAPWSWWILDSSVSTVK